MVPAPPSTQSRLGVERVDLLQRQATPKNIDGVWNPHRSTDITVHLSLNVQDDLDDALERVARLTRLGDFSGARGLFDRELEGHRRDEPQVAVLLAEILLQQGDYYSIAKIDPHPIETLKRTRPNDIDAQLLTVYWELIQLEAGIRMLSCSSKDLDILSFAIHVLTCLRESSFQERKTSSIEVSHDMYALNF